MRSHRQILLSFAAGIKRYFTLAFVAAIFFTFLNFLSPQIIRFTIDSVIGTEPFALPPALVEVIENMGGRAFLQEHLLACAAGVALCSLAAGICNFSFRTSIAAFAQGYVRNMRNKLFAHTQRLPFSWHVQNQTGDIIQRCTSDIDVVCNFLQIHLLTLMRIILIIVVALILMFSMNATLATVALVFIPVIASYSGIFFRMIIKRFRKADEAEGDLMVAVQENLTGVRVVRAFGREKYELERFDRLNDRFAKLWIDLGYTSGAYWGLGDLSTGLQVLAVMVGGAILAAQGQLTLGEFIVFISYNQMLAWPVRNLGRVLSELGKLRVSLGRILEILDAPEEQPEPDSLRPDLRQDIVFDDVTFSYENMAPVLQNLSFTIPAGSTFGILGGTGSGKSTITYLLNRLYDLPEDGGSIRIGDTDLRDIDRTWLRQNVGLVLQEPFLFSRTIAENIAIAAKDADLTQIRQSAAVAAVDDAIMSFTQGYDTLVGERGVTLSGGQKQRVAIARTLMQHAPVMIFDDSLSAVDLQTDQQIRTALQQQAAGATVILISHRINTLMQADRILVLEDGKAAQVGTHSQLLQQDGMYRRIYEMQSRAADVSAEGKGE